MQNRVWVNGTYRKWVVNKLVNARNPDGSQALDDNDLKNYSGKVVAQITPSNKIQASYLWNDKIRGHRRDTPPNIMEDIASLVQTNPVQTTQAKYTGIRNRAVFESNFSVMDGQTNYTYQPGTPADAIRRVDNARSEAFLAATREEHQPNSRHQFDNVISIGKSGWGGEHLFKGGVQWGRLYYESDYSVQGDHYVEYNNGVPTQVRQFNSPTTSTNVAKVLGIFLQDSWSMNRLTLNIGGRWDKYVGTLPEQSAPAARFIGARQVPETEVLNQSIAVWRAGASYDLTGNGRTARQGQLQPLRAAGRHRSRDHRQPAQQRQPDLPLDRPERRRHLPGIGSDGVAVLGVLGRRRVPLRRWHQVALLGRGHGGLRNPAAGRRPLRHDVLLPHQSRAVRAAQRGRADLGLHALHAEHPERPRRLARQPGPDDGDRLQHPGRIHQPERHRPQTTRTTSTRTTRAWSSPARSASRTSGRCRRA